MVLLTASRTRVMCNLVRIYQLSRMPLSRSISGLISRIDDTQRSSNIALVDADYSRPIKEMSYGQLSKRSKRVAAKLSEIMDPEVHSIGCYIGGHSDYVVAMLAVWRLGKRFVPLGITHPTKELQYFSADSDLGLILISSKSVQKDTSTTVLKISETVEFQNIRGLGIPLFDLMDYEEDSFSGKKVLHENKNENILDDVKKKKEGGYESCEVGDVDMSGLDNIDALVLYTSGTTGRPKGVAHTRKGLECLMVSLCTSWEYSETDKILHFLPLYHMHGLLNKLLCVLYEGGCVEFCPTAKSEFLWNRLAADSTISSAPLSLFMAVPTVYAKMIETARKIPNDTIEKARVTLRRMRLNVSGSASLPDTVMAAWLELSDQVLLERYGMTEIGMALSNSLRGERRKGVVGFNLPNVKCRIVDENEVEVGESEVEVSGELRIKGPGIFRAYINLPEVTLESFDKDGWFRTGDVAARTRTGEFRLLGRQSSDIIKCSGYKLSALEVEREILSHPQISEAIVVGVADETLGEKVVAIVTLRDLELKFQTAQDDTGIVLLEKGNTFQALKSLRTFLKDRMAQYKQPQELFIVDSIPRNHLGKVNKKSILQDLKLKQ